MHTHLFSVVVCGAASIRAQEEGGGGGKELGQKVKVTTKAPIPVVKYEFKDGSLTSTGSSNVTPDAISSAGAKHYKNASCATTSSSMSISPSDSHIELPVQTHLNGKTDFVATMWLKIASYANGATGQNTPIWSAYDSGAGLRYLIGLNCRNITGEVEGSSLDVCTGSLAGYVGGQLAFMDKEPPKPFTYVNVPREQWIHLVVQRSEGSILVWCDVGTAAGGLVAVYGDPHMEAFVDLRNGFVVGGAYGSKTAGWESQSNFTGLVDNYRLYVDTLTQGDLIAIRAEEEAEILAEGCPMAAPTDDEGNTGSGSDSESSKGSSSQDNSVDEGHSGDGSDDHDHDHDSPPVGTIVGIVLGVLVCLAAGMCIAGRVKNDVNNKSFIQKMDTPGVMAEEGLVAGGSETEGLVLGLLPAQEDTREAWPAGIEEL